MGRHKHPEWNERTCKSCGVTKPRSEYYGKNYHDCKDCQRRTVLENQAKHKEYYSEYRNQYRKENLDRARRWSKVSNERYKNKNGVSASTRYYQTLKSDQEKYGRYRNNQYQYRMKNIELLKAKAKARYWRNKVEQLKMTSKENKKNLNEGSK